MIKQFYFKQFSLAQAHSFCVNINTVQLQTIQFTKSMQFNSQKSLFDP